MKMNERQKQILFWLLVIGVIVASGLACQYALELYPPPQAVPVSNISQWAWNNTHV